MTIGIDYVSRISYLNEQIQMCLQLSMIQLQTVYSLLHTLLDYKFIPI